MSADQTTFLGVSIGCLLWMALVALLIVGGAGFTVWYNYHLAVPIENSNRYVATCSMQYLTTQKTRIENDLSAISNNNVEIVATQDQNLKTQLQAQEKQNADDIYNALDASQCSHQQIIQDMPELQSFFSQFPNR
jgi:preprotein translocase subunit SecF